MADTYLCRTCSKVVASTKNGRYRTHFNDQTHDRCEMASVEIPADLLEQGPIPAGSDPTVPVEGMDFAQCPQCTRKVKLTRLGYFEPHDETLLGGNRCLTSGVRAKHARKQEDVLLPGDEKASPIPKVKDSATPAANRGITSAAPTSTSAGADSSPKELPPRSGTTEIDWSDVEGSPEYVSVKAANAKPIDWSKVGDLKHSPPAEEIDEKEAAEEEAEREFLALAAESGASTETSFLESSSTSTPSPDSTSDSPTFSLGTRLSERFLQPFSPFLQPAEWIPPALVFIQPEAYEGPVKGEPMGDLAKELATRIKETFYSYSNRKSTDNRSAQTTLGPSEIGTPCDRRLAMALMGVPAVNPGGDGWAAFVGTCTHVGMAEIYTFADAGTGRYSVEMPVFLGVPEVPRGTTDLLDRRDGTIVDWKVMGAYSLKKFKAEGPSITYRAQAHTYGYGAELAGEKVRNVAIVGLPRAGSSLDEMHVWTEKYDKKVALAALKRVEKIAADVQALEAEQATWAGLDVAAGRMRKAKTFEAGDDCRYCPFFLKKDEDMARGCPGK